MDTLREKETDAIDITQIVSEHYEEMIQSQKQLEGNKREYKQVLSYLSDIQKLEMLPPDQAGELKHLAGKVMLIEQDKQTYKSEVDQLSGEQYRYMSLNEDKMVQTIKALEEEEKEIYKIKRDMEYLEGEKGALKIEKREYKEHLRLLQGVSKIAAASLALLFIFLMAANFLYSINTNIFVFIIIGLAIILTFVIFMLNGSTKDKLRMNDAKLNKAITLLNKIKLQYVNIKSRLEYVYEKNGVHNAYELKGLWSQYVKLSKSKQVYRQTKDMLYGVSEELHKLLSSYQIGDANEWFDRIEIIIDEDRREETKNSLAHQMKILKNKIDEGTKIVEQSKKEIMNLANTHREYTDEILQLASQYETWWSSNNQRQEGILNERAE